MKKINIAVIGSGISGLCAAWLLSQRHDVTLIEADSRLGGHAHTTDVESGGRRIAVDTGFIVSNRWTYPNFSALLHYLDVETVTAPMSFSVSLEEGRYEYSGHSLGALAGSPRQWFSPRHWRMMADLLKFYRSAQNKAACVPAHVTVGQFLKAEGYSDHFIDRHILPMAGAIWSASPQQIADYPFQAFVKFFANHKLFDLVSRPDWQTIKGGARSYVERLVDDGRFTTRLASPVQRLRRDGLGVDVFFADGSQERFEHVVLATHADQALRLLADPSRAETELLSPFRTSANQVYLHRDRALMPRHKRFWSAWNYQGNGGDDESRLAVTYWMNELQQLETPEQHFVSLNPVTPPDPALVDGQHLYRHPIFNAQTLAAQQQLWHLQGARRTWFCGAWFGAGFHEDGAQAGLAVAEQLGDLSRPWSVAEPSGRIHVRELPRSVRPGYVEAAE